MAITEVPTLNVERPAVPGHDPLVSRASRLMAAPWLPWLLLGFGAVLLGTQYLSNRSLWLDEAWLALSIMDRSPGELLAPLDNDQVAPVGFLLLVKLATTIVGTGEQAFRLVPLLFGLLSLPLFYRLARAVLAREAMLLALVFFVSSSYLLYYASELKPYMLDVAFALMLLLAARNALEGARSRMHLLLLGVLGAVAPWFSLGSVLVLVGIGMTMLVPAVRRRAWLDVTLIGALGLLWLASFAAQYMLVLGAAVQNNALSAHWQSAFMPIPDFSLRALSRTAEWLGTSTLRLFSMPGGFGLNGLAALVSAMGIISFWKEKRLYSVLLTAPLLVALWGAMLHQYPFADRMLLFWIPCMMITMAEGLWSMWRHAAGRFRMAAALGALLLVLPVLYGAVTRLYQAPFYLHGEEMRPAVQYLKQQMQPDDILYVYPAADGPFRYYAQRSSLQAANVRTLDVGAVRTGFGLPVRDDWNTHVDAIEKMRGEGRVWVLIYPMWNNLMRQHGLFYRDRLNQMARPLDAKDFNGASLLLYDVP